MPKRQAVSACPGFKGLPPMPPTSCFLLWSGLLRAGAAGTGLVEVYLCECGRKPAKVYKPCVQDTDVCGALRVKLKSGIAAFQFCNCGGLGVKWLGVAVQRADREAPAQRPSCSASFVVVLCEFKWCTCVQPSGEAMQLQDLRMLSILYCASMERNCLLRNE